MYSRTHLLILFRVVMSAAAAATKATKLAEAEKKWKSQWKVCPTCKGDAIPNYYADPPNEIMEV
jgi:hypothetical protein